MSFLCESVVITGPGGSFEVEQTTWCALLHLGAMPEPDEYGRPRPGEQWKQQFVSDSLDDKKLPVFLSAEQARTFADSLETYSAFIPEYEEIGEVLNEVDKVVNGEWKKFAVTRRKGWVQTDDVSLLFLEEGKGIIRDVIELCRRGPVEVDLARNAEPSPRLRIIKTIPGRPAGKED